jgi:polyphosphate kinase
VKVPEAIPRFVPIPNLAHASGQSFAFLEDVIRLNIGALFPGIHVAGAHLFRIIRDTDLELQEEGAEDLMESVDRTLRQMRHGAPSLLHVEAGMPKRVVNILVENFEVEEDIVMRSGDRLGFADWMALHRLPRPELKDAPFTPRTLWPATEHECIFDRIREHDFLVHHPYDSFDAVETFLRDATRDPLVVAIKIALYRIGPNSPLVDLLIEAADAGKQVAALVELKARFDERNNIQWAMRLESAGIHVVYGVENLKTHCKLCLVVRKEADGVRRYVHIGTGNYNRATSQIYTDLGLFTADPGTVEDVTEVFNSITGYSARREYDDLLVAPVNLRSRLEELVEREIAHAVEGRPARIIIKNNAITDPAAIRLLYRASQAGVDVDLIVRGICCLRPGLPGVSERIHVRSIVGRFLEHSRVYWFANGGAEELFLGSADLMERNLDRRVETLARVRSTTLVRHIRDVMLETYLHDNTRAYVMHDNVYTPSAPAPGEDRVAAQEQLLDLYTSPPSDDSLS